ncbi:hypothetical protein EBU95_18200, partial [bacterium]|nr:hypothetical protein [bacterium]
DAYYKDRSDINSVSIFEERKNVTVVSKILETTILGKECAFIPWGEEINHLSKKDIIFGHFEIESFKMNSYKLCERGTKTAELLDKSDLVLTGHFHLREERCYKEKKIVYVGNPFEMDFGDVGSTKGYYILDFNNSSLTFYENKFSPKHIKLSLSDLLQNAEKLNIETISKNNIVKILIDKKIAPDSIDMLLKKVSAYKPFSLSVDYTVSNNITINEDLTVDVSGVDIEKAIEEFINALDIQDKEDIINYCRELYKRCK